MKRISSNSPVLMIVMIGVPVLVLWLSMNLVTKRVNIWSRADQGTVAEEDNGELVWVERNSILVMESNGKLLFKMNSIDSDVDSVSLHMQLPNETIDVKSLTPGIFGAVPEYIKEGRDLYIVINNIGVQGAGDLFTLELTGIAVNDDKLLFVKEDSFARGSLGKIALSLPDVEFSY